MLIAPLTRFTSKSVHGDLICGPCSGAEGNTARIRSWNVVIAPYTDEATQTGSCVHGQQCVQSTAHCIESPGSTARRDPAVPNGFATIIASVIWLTGFFRCRHITA